MYTIAGRVRGYVHVISSPMGQCDMNPLSILYRVWAGGVKENKKSNTETETVLDFELKEKEEMIKG